MKYKIKDDDNHAKDEVVVESDSPSDALEKYVRDECHDVGDGEEVNVELTDEDGVVYVGTADIEEVREVHVFVRKKRRPRAVPPEQ